MPLQPVEKVASGGEMSRLVLSLKSLVARSGQLPTVIFDEIDTGVSGSVADRMGEIIVRLSSGLQVINITHLPQVAAKGSDHFFVYKEESASGHGDSYQEAGAFRTRRADRPHAQRDRRDRGGARAGPPAARRPGLLTEVRTFRYFVPASETGFPRIA